MADPLDPAATLLHPGDAPYVVALAALDPFPRQLADMVFAAGAEASWHAVRAGRPPIPVPELVARTWRARARACDPDALWLAHRASGIGIALFGSATYPAELLDDPEAPLVLFHRGDVDVCSGPRVAIVGTRQATAYGLDVAESWGRQLSELGVCVLSGLALGIDAAAHRGALRGPTPPVAVVGSGLDRVYPRRNEALWQVIGERGLLVSEYPLGVPPVAVHFPARNRILAALADVVVVVESHRAGGSLLTAAAALARHRTVFAVPGPVHSAASHGTNALLRDGACLAADIDDVVIALGMSRGARREPRESRPAPSVRGAAMLDAIGWAPARLDRVVAITGWSVAEVADEAERLLAHGWILATNGWFERVSRDRAQGTSPGSAC